MTRFSGPRPGVSALELLVAVTLGGVIALGVTAVAIREVDGRSSNDESLAIQQGVASVLQLFSKDVRQGSGLAVSTASECRIRQVGSDGATTYVTYRLSGGQLQRGTAATATATPASFRTMFDADRFTSPAGRFTYFTIGNGTSAESAKMRRIEIAGFQLRVTRSNRLVTTPAISAVMREAANVRDLVPSCAAEVASAGAGGGGGSACSSRHTHHDDGRGGCDRDDSQDGDASDADDADTGNGGNNPGGATTRVMLCAKNTTGLPIVLNGFGADWGPASASSAIIMKIWIGGGSPVWHKNALGHTTGGVPKTFKRTVTIPAGASVDLQVDFKGASAIDMKTLAVKLYATADGDRANPYLITASLP